MKSILLPTDFSNNALHAIQYTIALFKNEPCKFYLMHVHQASAYISDDLMHVPTSESIHKILVDNTKKSLTDLVSQLCLVNNDNHEFLMIVDYDNFIDAIDQACKAYNIDLIAMGMQGKSAAEQVLFGSHTTRVIQRTNSPVLIIPENYTYAKLDKAILSIINDKDFINSDIDCYNWLYRLFDFQTTILNFDTTKTPEEVEVHMQELLENIPFRFKHIDTKDVLKTTTFYINNNQIGLVVLGREKHSFLQRLFTKHQVEKMTYNIKIPMLVLGDA